MFWKLRLRLSLINAAVAALILLAIAAVSYIFISNVIRDQSEQAIQSIARDVETADSLGFPSPGVPVRGAGGLYPYIVLRANEDLRFSVVAFMINDLTEDQIRELATLALSNEKQAAMNKVQIQPGTDRSFVIVRRQRSAIVRLPDGQAFRYFISGFRTGATGVYFIFMDIRQEEHMLSRVRLALGGSVLGGMLLTLLGGLFLAGRALRPIRAAWQKQKSFVADASHELRSPLAAIRCNLDVVIDDPQAPVEEKRMYWDGISEETDRMTALVDDLLLLARADSDAVVLQKERVDLKETAEAAVGIMQPLASKKGIELKLEVSDTPAAQGDRARLKQVLIALVDNAVKYTPEGGRVTVTVRRSKDRALIDVADSGIGIPKEHLGKVFERFYRVDKARERESGGHGLGLSIAQWIVQQHGGNVFVASEEGRGSCFTVSLPLIKD